MRRYTILYRLTLCLAFLLSASCSRKDTRPLPEELVRAEHLMWQAPDSALHVLQSMPVPPESQRLAHATWALLTAQAKYRLGLSQTDSLIHIACDYFHRHGDARQKAYTYNYMASISKELQRQEEAQRFYHLAAEEVERTDDNRLGYLICIGLSELYAYQRMGEDALRLADKAMEYAHACSDSFYCATGEKYRARAYGLLRDQGKAATCYKEALHWATDPEAQSGICNELAGIYRNREMIDSAFCYMRRMQAINRKYQLKETAANYAIMSDIYNAANQLDSAAYYAERILADTTVRLVQKAGAHQNLYFLYEKQGDYQKAAEHCFAFCECLNSLFQENQSRSLAEIQAKYDRQKVINEKNRITIWMWRGGCFLLALMVVVVCLYQRKLRGKEQRIRRLEGEIEEKTVQIQRNKWQMTSLQEDIDELNRQIEESDGHPNGLHQLIQERNNLKQQLEQLELENTDLRGIVDKRCKQLEAQSRTVTDYDRHLRKLKERNQELAYSLIQCTPVLKALVNEQAQPIKPEEWKAIRKALDLRFSQYVTRLQTFCPLTDTDLELCCLLKLGLSNQRVALLLSIEESSVTKRKVRLKKELMKHPGALTKQDSLDEWLQNF